MHVSCRADADYQPVRLRGAMREVSLFLLETGAVAVGDYVLVHVGYAIQSISPRDADASWALFDEITSGPEPQHA
jgi:hydrogenase expression/formation protein HypC